MWVVAQPAEQWKGKFESRQPTFRIPTKGFYGAFVHQECLHKQNVWLASNLATFPFNVTYRIKHILRVSTIFRSWIVLLSGLSTHNCLVFILGGFLCVIFCFAFKYKLSTEPGTPQTLGRTEGKVTRGKERTHIVRLMQFDAKDKNNHLNCSSPVRIL